MLRGGALTRTIAGTATRAGISNARVVSRHACTNAWNSMALHRGGALSVLRQQRMGSAPSALFRLGGRMKSTQPGVRLGAGAGAGAVGAGGRAASGVALADAGTKTAFDKAMYIPKKYPFAFQSVFAMLKTMMADAAVQIYGEGKDTQEKFDFKRNAVFAAFGFGYLGCAQWFFYVTVMQRIFPNMGRFAEQTWRAKLKDGRSKKKPLSNQESARGH